MIIPSFMGLLKVCFHAVTYELVLSIRILSLPMCYLQFSLRISTVSVCLFDDGLIDISCS